MTTDSISQKKASTFRMECRVSIHIHAAPERVWALLTDAADFPRWNSTVSSIKGSIALGEKLELRVPISDRTFSPKVTELVPAARMVWSDGMAPMFKGERTFTLTPRADGSTDFEMVEIFSGVMLPMIKGSLPDFGPVFDRYALDLKTEAEGRAS
ncbi:MAG TPA: SRPBCC domain-containing protein [Labilithrix sp.]|nr:SRPBCC domain-containing protein [Labilithrix sp.]